MKKSDVAKIKPGATVIIKVGKYGSEYEFEMVDPEPKEIRGKWRVQAKVLEAPSHDLTWRRPYLMGVTKPLDRSGIWPAGEVAWIRTREIRDFEAEGDRAQARSEVKRIERETKEAARQLHGETQMKSLEWVKGILDTGRTAEIQGRGVPGAPIRITGTLDHTQLRVLAKLGEPSVVIELECNLDGTIKRGDEL